MWAANGGRGDILEYQVSVYVEIRRISSCISYTVRVLLILINRFLEARGVGIQPYATNYSQFYGGLPKAV